MGPHQGTGELNVAPFDGSVISNHALLARLLVGAGHIVRFFQNFVELAVVQQNGRVEFLSKITARFPLPFHKLL